MRQLSQPALDSLLRPDVFRLDVPSLGVSSSSLLAPTSAPTSHFAQACGCWIHRQLQTGELNTPNRTFNIPANNSPNDNPNSNLSLSATNSNINSETPPETNPVNASTIATLLAGPRWNQNSPLGTGVTLTYSFLASVPTDYSPASRERRQFQALTAAQTTAVTQALGRWGAVANINFQPVTDPQTAQLRFGSANLGDRVAAYAYFPGAGIGGDVWLNHRYSENRQPQPGNFAFATLLHEIGHALGLKHPGNYDRDLAPFLPAHLDNGQYSVMSYYAPPGSQLQPYNPMLLDIAAIQTIYGANRNTLTGNDVYRWTDPFVTTIWDGGGRDTIDASTQTTAVTINLNAGSFSSIGVRGGNNPALARHNLGIADGVMIENALGGQGDDQLIGNSTANQLNGQQGQDSLEGGAGNDTLFGGRGNDRLLGGSGNDVLIGSMGADTLTGGAGADRFHFGLGTKLAGASPDILTDFDPLAGDSISLAVSVFPQLTVGNLVASQYGEGSSVEVASQSAFRANGNQAGAAILAVAIEVESVGAVQIWYDAITSATQTGGEILLATLTQQDLVNLSHSPFRVI